MHSSTAGDSNDSDVLTKGLDHLTHWRHAYALGMRPARRASIVEQNLEHEHEHEHEYNEKAKKRV